MSEVPAPGDSARYPDLAGQVAVVTGAAQGIGQGVAMRLAAEGMSIVAADIDAASLGATADLLRDYGVDVLAFQGDLSTTDTIDRMFSETVETFGAVHLLVNNAADLQRRSLLDEHEALLDLQLAVNIRGPYVCSQRAARLMEGRGGSIINISSVGGVQAHHWGFPYDVTKGAINMMTKAMAVDLGRYGIRANAVAPGVTFTYRTEGRTEHPGYRSEVEGIPLGRSGSVDDIGAAVAFLASAEASYISGQVLYVDGGMTAQLAPPRPGELERFDQATTETGPLDA